MTQDSSSTITYCRRRLATMARTDSERPRVLIQLADAFRASFGVTGDITELREAAKACRVALSLATGNGQCYRRIQEILLTLFEQPDNPAGHAAARALPWSYPWNPDLAKKDTEPAVCLRELAMALRHEYLATNELPDLRDAVESVRRAIGFARSGDRRDRELLVELLRMMAERTGKPGPLDEALTIAWGLCEESRVDSGAYAAALNTLSALFRQSYQLTGDLDALRKAVDLGPGAATSADPLPVAFQIETADQLGMLAQRTDDLSMARASISAARAAIGPRATLPAPGAALGRIPPDDSGWVRCQSVLGGTLTYLATRTGDAETITLAVRETRRAVGRTPVTDIEYLPRLDLLYQALMLRFGQSADAAALSESVAVARAMAGTAPADHPERAKYLSELGHALRELYARSGDIHDLQDSAKFAREAVTATQPDHPDRAAQLANLGELLRFLHEKTGDPAILRELIRVGSSLAGLASASAGQRITGAQQAARADLEAGRNRHAMDMIRQATELLPQLALRDVDRADREYRMSTAHRLPATAATVAILSGQPERAVELLEQTRGVVYAGTLDTRADVTELRDRAPDLLPRFEEIRDSIDAADHELAQPASAVRRDGTGQRPRELASRRVLLNERWNDVLDEIRGRPGLADFLKPTSAQELCRHTGQGPVSFVLTDESRAHALIVGSDPAAPVSAVALPAAVTRASVMARATTLREALATATDRGESVRARRGAQLRLLDILTWSWDNITEPVLSHLGYRGAPENGHWRRIWWCPVGVMALLPLHAAGYHDGTPGADTVMDRVISSYTPTIRALAHARRAGDGHAVPSALVVSVPDAPDSAVLDGTGQETGIVRRFIPGAAVVPAAGTLATHDTVTEALQRCGIVHLACHGYADLADPSASRLLLHDHRTNPLTLHSITRLNLRHAQLAYLSACSTTVLGEQHADEATHLTAAFQLAGYSHVIGTLWPINDQTAITVATSFYETLTAGGSRPPDLGLAAEALHHAVRNLRDAAPALPSRWAAYLHSGA
jgi:hypothetical protein